MWAMQKCHMKHLLSILFCLILTHVAGAALKSSDLLRAPRVPVQLYGLLQREEQAKAETSQLYSTFQDNSTLRFSSAEDPPQYQAYTFDQRVSHLDDIPAPVENESFKQRYWFNAEHYKPGGPVFLLDGGETNGEDRFPFMRQGILEILSRAHNGIAFILEHRYYGESFPVNNLTTDSMRFLSTEMSLLDSKYFAQNVKPPGVNGFNNNASPWIYYGGSYAGAKAAFARKLYPDVFWGAIASSAVTKAIAEFWEYYEPIRKSAPRQCVQLLINHTNLIDQLLDLNNYAVTSSLKFLFGLPNVTMADDFVNTLAFPLGSWQERNWDAAVGSHAFGRFCEALTSANVEIPSEVRDTHTLLESRITQFGWPSRKAFAELTKYAQYIRTNVASLCPAEMSQDECFGHEGVDSTGLDQSSWRSWTWQFCTEFGFFITSSPKPSERLVSRRIDVKYTSAVCQKAFPDGELVRMPSWPNVERINKWGGYKIRAPRLAFVDGSMDPWLYATPHSPHTKGRKDSLEEPYKLIDGGVHHWDENGRSGRSGGEPDSIRDIHAQEIEFVAFWLREWEERGRWRPE
ncbi:BQ2448_7299 [Microbotryum intermedium]|uniref:BQ2448_7299 protein n=1 Tax=Microbotryum intermedium TaxID=269621 RepID=A0A238FMY9_9BASI|nr:BQ2448_7299 [Microbotryum intermedium]